MTYPPARPPYPDPGPYPQQPFPGYSVPYGSLPNPFAPAPHNYAHWGLRVAAKLVDSLLSVPFLIIILVAVFAGVDFGSYDPQTGQSTGGGIAVWAVIAIIVSYLGMFAVGIWNAVFLEGKTGQTVGKKALKIKVIKEATGEPIGVGLAFARILAHIVDGVPSCFPLGYMWLLWDPKRQTFADKLLSTVVIKTQG